MQQHDKQTVQDIPSFSVIIPVYNEAACINSTLTRLKTQSGIDQSQIIVVDASAESSTIKVIEHNDVIAITSPKGRAIQMNAGADIATGGILLFLHADTQLPPGAFETISNALRDSDYVAGAFDLEIDSTSKAIRFIAAAARFKNRLLKTPFGDQAVFFRSNYFKQIGGYKDIPIMEDVEVMRRIKKRSDKIIILKDRVRTSPRRWQNEGIIKCTARNQLIITLYYCGVSPDNLAKLYRSDYESEK